MDVSQSYSWRRKETDSEAAPARVGPSDGAVKADYVNERSILLSADGLATASDNSLAPTMALHATERQTPTSLSYLVLTRLSQQYVQQQYWIVISME